MAKKREDEYDGWVSIDPNAEMLDPAAPQANPQPVPSVTPATPGGFGIDIQRPSYESKHGSKIEALADKIANRPAFSYDPNQDPLYGIYKDQYTRAGQRAMDDTIGKVAARTGGLASSYATSAGQQAYNEHMAKLAAQIPALQQLAYGMYKDQGAADMQALNMMMGLEDRDYGRYQDRLGQFNRDRGFVYDAAVRKDQTDYDRGRDKIMDERYASELQRKQAEDKARQMAAYGDFSGFKALGYSDAEIAAMTNGYRAEMARKAEMNHKATSKQKVSSGSPGDDSPGDQDYNSLYAAAWSSGNPENYIASHYEDYGFAKGTGLYNGYKEWAEEKTFDGKPLYTDSHDFKGTVEWARRALHGKYISGDPGKLYDMMKRNGYGDAAIDQVFAALGL